LGVFNHNIRYLRTKIYRESLADFAKRLGESDGKLGPYEQQANPKQEFYQKLATQCGLDLHAFLTIEMNENNEDEFFYDKKGTLRLSDPSHGKVNALLDQLMEAEDMDKRSELVKSLRELIMEGWDDEALLKKELIEQNRAFAKIRGQMIGFIGK